jgi:hypothetical protein
LIKDPDDFEKIRKTYKLIRECIHINDIPEKDALNALAYYIIVSASAQKASVDEFDKMMDTLKMIHRKEMEKMGLS